MQASLNEYACSLPPTNISGYQSADVPEMVPHTSYIHSCMMNSMNGTSMALLGYDVNPPDDGVGESTASFTIFNPGPGDKYGIRNITVTSDGAWHECQGGEYALPWQLLSCQYLLDLENNNISFQLQWDCDDRDPYHA